MKNKKIKSILKIVFITIMIFSIINLIYWKNENNNNEKIVKKELKKIKTDNGKKYLDESIIKDNKYTIGWLIVEGTNINYPVVKYKDNSYYLNHDFNNNYNSAGWIFMDYKNQLDDQNIVIYGHHRRDGSMFGSIDNLLKIKQGGKIKFITNNKELSYNIFSIYKTEKEYNYRETNYNNFNKKTQEFKKRSLIKYNVDIIDKNQIITLSTCDNNNKNRIVVHGINI